MNTKLSPQIESAPNCLTVAMQGLNCPFKERNFQQTHLMRSCFPSSEQDAHALLFIPQNMAKYRVYNRRQQGLAETTRLILEISGAEYENLFPEDWEKEKASTPLGQLPVLHVQVNPGKWESIAESHSMERFLAANLGLLGSTPVEAAVLDMYHAAWSDMIALFMWKVWRESDQEAKKRGAAEFWVSFPKFLEAHEKILASRGPFYGGDKPSLPDIYAFTWLNRFITGWIPSPPGSITEDQYPRMWELWRGIRENSRIKDYFESGRWELKE